MEANKIEDLYIIKKINDLCDGKLEDDLISDLIFLNDIKFKYYEQFEPGLSFFDHLYLWLENFDKTERNNALKIVESIIFFSREEMQILSRQLFREKIKKFLLKVIIEEKENISPFDYNEAYKYFNEYLDQSLFIALSDGAMMDFFRRKNIKNNDQTISYYKLHLDAQFEIAFKNFEEKNTQYRFFFLIEDFVGTGTTFLRDKNNIEFWLNEENIEEIINCESISEFTERIHPKPDLKGQLIRFLNYWGHLIRFSKNYRIIYCPYIMTSFSKNRLKAMLKYYGMLNYIQNYQRLKILPHIKVPNELRVIKCCSKSGLRNIKEESAVKIKKLCDKYYNKIIPHITKSHRLGGGLKYGFGQRGFAIVRYNNVPNNSIFLLWFPKNWKALFPRYIRHKK